MAIFRKKGIARNGIKYEYVVVRSQCFVCRIWYRVQSFLTERSELIEDNFDLLLFNFYLLINTKARHLSIAGSVLNSAPTYSPTCYGNTIGSGGLNYSVRNGKRWTPPI